MAYGSIGRARRIAAFAHTVERNHCCQIVPAATMNLKSKGSRADGMIRFNDVDLVTPKGECLASNLDFTITPSTPLMVTGANAVGKSSLFRAMGSLWEVKKGHIDKPCDDTGRLDIKDIFLVPQRVYMVLGSLGDQIKTGT